MTTTQTLSKAASTWADRLLRSNTEIAHGHVNQFKNLVAPLAAGYAAGGHKSSLTASEAEMLMESFEERVARDGGPAIPAEGAARGRDWLVKYAVKLGMPDVDYSTITRFTLCGALVVDQGRYRPWTAPTYRCYFADGSELDYSPTAWQAGGSGGCDYRWNKYPANWL